MSGLSKTTFSPNATTTCGMIVTILYRQEGEPKVYSDCEFTDVASGAWYEDAIPYRYAKFKGEDATADGGPNKYTDEDQISDYAEKVVSWAVAEGLISGVTETTSAPGATATRAQVTTILVRFNEL